MALECLLSTKPQSQVFGNNFLILASKMVSRRYQHLVESYSVTCLTVEERWYCNCILDQFPYYVSRWQCLLYNILVMTTTIDSVL